MQFSSGPRSYTSIPLGSPAWTSRDFRNALGTFPTGVAIMTTQAPDGRPIGLTCNSFSSVSLTPPLILWSLARKAASFNAFMQAGHFAVNILAAAQQDLSRKFSSPADRFAGTPYTPGVGGVPLIDGAAAQFQCVCESRHDGGDHVIFIGRVIGFAYSNAEPLVYHRGNYANLALAESA